MVSLPLRAACLKASDCQGSRKLWSPNRPFAYPHPSPKPQAIVLRFQRV